MSEHRVVKIDVAAETAATATTHPLTGGTWLIWSNTWQKWWGPNQRGYTQHQAEAGRYSWAEALEIFEQTNRGWNPATSPDLPSVFLVVVA